ncbi:flavodoxin [Kribbella sp. CA-247076]|uniref:flavodoxin n=1 Tax=Kribbella sp. CA-247076 TaxID=3239941 RepID=UPI003D8D204A
MRRRTLLTSSLAVVAGAASGTSLTGCSERPSTSATPTPRPSGTPGARVLVAYFSRAGENYYYGDTTILEVGNTQVVAEMITAAVEADGYRIEAADPYPDGYRATVERNVREQNEDARPAIAGALPDVDDYDTVLLGSGIWNVQPPMIMRTFVEGVDLSGKRIFPFVTYAVSGLGRTVDDYTRHCPRSTIGDALAVRGEQVRDARPEVEAWLRRIGLLPR